MYLVRSDPVKTRIDAADWLLPAIFLALLAVPLPAAGQCPAPLTCRADATLTRLFTPFSVPGRPYQAYVTDEPVEKVAERYRGLAPAPSSGSWVVREMDPLDAFGDAGPYDETKVARLYLGRRARVARGPLVQEGRTVASITLISPYPDPSLSRLEPGTLIIEFRVPSTLRGR